MWSPGAYDIFHKYTSKTIENVVIRHKMHLAHVSADVGETTAVASNEHTLCIRKWRRKKAEKCYSSGRCNNHINTLEQSESESGKKAIYACDSWYAIQTVLYCLSTLAERERERHDK